MDEENRLNQIRQEIIQLYKRRSELVEQSRQQMMQEIPSNSVDANTNMAGGTASNVVDINTGMANSTSKSQERGKVLTLSNGHSIYDDKKVSNGFINMVIMALLAGFASGAIATAIYIFINLGKVTISL